MYLIPLFGHMGGNSRVAIQEGDSWPLQPNPVGPLSRVDVQVVVWSL
jgi:hypothetical protein